MMAALSALLLPVAVVLELTWRSRSVDEHGHLCPSLREQAIFDRYRRAAERSRETAKQIKQESKP